MSRPRFRSTSSESPLIPASDRRGCSGDVTRAIGGRVGGRAEELEGGRYPSAEVGGVDACGENWSLVAWAGFALNGDAGESSEPGFGELGADGPRRWNRRCESILSAISSCRYLVCTVVTDPGYDFRPERVAALDLDVDWLTLSSVRY
jgi:hypothetical protein